MTKIRYDTPILIQLILLPYRRKRRCTNLILLLVRNAPDMLDWTDDHGYTALMHAAKYDHPHIVEALLRNGASPDIRETYTVFRDTATSWAAYKGNLECVRLLISYGADKDQQTVNDGKTLLMWAYSQSQPHVFQYLVHRGCCLRKQTKNGHCLTDNLRSQYKVITEQYLRTMKQAVDNTLTHIPADLVSYIMLFY